MNSFSEKEKKLQEALNELQNFKFNGNIAKDQIKNVQEQKNQLVIEKSYLEKKYNNLLNEFQKLKTKLDELNNKKKDDINIENQFDEKIDELNQETDILIEEIDKWQM